MKIATWLPMQAWDDLTFEQTRKVGEFARRAEDLGGLGPDTIPLLPEDPAPGGDGD